MKKISTLITVLVLSQSAFSQQSDFNALINQLQSSFSKVETGSKTFEQEIKPLEFSSIKYNVNEIDQKGNKVSFSYELNLSDIDPYAVRQVTQKDLILVVLSVKNKQKLIRGSKNGEQIPYNDELNLHAKDVDHARSVMDLVKKSIPLAEKITAAKLKLSGYADMMSWLGKNIKNVTTGNKSVTQTLAPGDFTGSLKLTQVESDGKSSHQEESVFNVADINPNTISFKISGSTFGVEIETMQKLKSIKITRDNQSKPFSDDVVIYTNNVDEARDIKTVLTLLIPIAQAKLNSENPALKNSDQALKNLSTFIKDVKVNEKTTQQTIVPKCIASLTTVEQSASTTVKEQYDFNFMDLNPNLVKVQVSGEKMTLELPTLDKKKVVMEQKNEKLDGYQNEINIAVENYEVARRLQYSVTKAIELCKNEYKEPFSNNSTEVINWLQKNIGEVTIDQVSHKQTLELAEPGNENKIKLTQAEIKSSSSVEEVFEFNMSDINPSSIDYEVKGKWLFVSMETNFKNKIIKAYKAGKIQPYSASLEVAVKDIETARSTIAGLKKLVEKFKGK